jgi:serine/threonine protein kinase
MATPAVTSPPSSAPAKLGRYVVVRELGRGAQGRVYLARDDQLQREVAIKTLADARNAARKQSLLAEARTTARLQHPNVVALFDAFEHDEMLCVVLEYVPGETIEALLRRQGPVATDRAAAITAQMLDGLSYAHERGIVHRDIKPANILIDAVGTARIMDFGIAVAAGDAESAAPAGTPRYMAPETMDKGAVAASADVFSVGMTLYEMLTGRPAVEGRNVFEVLHKIANRTICPPSAHNAEVDEALDQIVMRAIAKDPAERYRDARDMRTALEHYLRPGADEDGPEASHAGSGGVIEFLLNRMRHKSSFPALSGTISAINRVTSGHEQNVQALTDVLLKDFALTNKLLRMVNSTGYGQFGGNISTISRAVLIMGFDAVRDLAVTLVLFEHLQNKGQANRLRDEVIHSLFNGIVTRRIARGIGARDSEEGFVCGVFRHLGRLLASFYLYDESLEVGRRLQQANETEATASRAVLGVTYEELGIVVARSWNLPPAIVGAMKQDDQKRPVKPVKADAVLKMAADIGESVVAAANSGSPQERDRQLCAIAQRFRDVVRIDEKMLGAVAADALDELLSDTARLIGDHRKSRLCQHLRQTAGQSAESAPAGADTLEQVIEQTQRITDPADGGGRAVDSAQVLSAGIQDITNSLVDNFSLSQLLRIILETMYRGMGFERVILFMRDPRAFTLTARFGYGSELDRIVAKLTLPFGREQDVFSVALAKNVDLLISDIDADNIRARIPDTFRRHGLGRTFVLLPIVIDNKALGLFYADKANAGDLIVEPREMNLLKTLRNQAVLALRQRR